jgi:two-component system chemotaxis response regulator CheY
VPRILLVDDSALVRSSMQKALEPFGVDLGHAENGKVCVDKAMASSWDLIFLDVVMPIMDGPAALREIRARGNTTPVVLVTSVSTTSVVASAIKLGGVHYIGKPFTPEQIRGVATALLKLGVAPGVAQSFVLLQHDDPELLARLRKALPAHVAVDSARSLAESLDLAESCTRDLVIIDSRELGDELTRAANELRGVLPAAGIFATSDDVANPPWHPRAGLDGILPRTLEAALVRDFLFANFLRPLVSLDRMVARAAGFIGPAVYLPAYLASLGRAVVESCIRLDATGDLEIDLRAMPADPDAVVAVVTEVDRKLRAAGTAPAFQISAAIRDQAADRLAGFVIR